MKKVLKTLVIFLAVISAFSCSKKYVSIDEEVSVTLVKAKELMAEKKHRNIIDLLSLRINKFSGVPGVDSLVYFLGISFIETEDYEQGVLQLRRLVDSFRNSPLRPEAYYYMSQAYVRRLPIPTREQKLTRMALRELNTFTELYPDHPLMENVKKDIKICRNLLAQYVFEIGYFYYRKEEYSPARAYFSDVIVEYIDTDLADDARVMISASYINLLDNESAKKEFEIVDYSKVTPEYKEYFEFVKKELEKWKAKS